jgi:hypothetical protein
MNGHVFKQTHAMDVIHADIVCREVELYRSYSPLLAQHQVRVDYQACYFTLLTVAIVHMAFGAFFASCESFGFFRILGIVYLLFGLTMLTKMIRHHPFRVPVDQLLRTDQHHPVYQSD